MNQRRASWLTNERVLISNCGSIAAEVSHNWKWRWRCRGGNSREQVVITWATLAVLNRGRAAVRCRRPRRLWWHPTAISPVATLVVTPFLFLNFFFFFYLLNFKFHFTVSFCLVLLRLFVCLFFQLFGHVDINSWTEFDWTVRVDFITWLNVNTNAEMLLPSFYFVSTAPLIEIWFVKLFHSNWVE